MTGNNRLFSYWFRGKLEYVHAASAIQGAIALKEKLGLNFVSHYDLREVKEHKALYCYRAWYRTNADSRTQYIYIVARSLKQAWFLYYEKGYTKMYDFAHKDSFEEKELQGYYNFGIYGEDSEVAW